jgi:hypothetical protein
VVNWIAIERLQCEATRAAAKIRREFSSVHVRTHEFGSRIVLARGAASEFGFSVVTDPDPIPAIPPLEASDAADTIGG